MSDFKQYPCRTRHERDCSLEVCMQVYALIVKKLGQIRSMRTIRVNPEFVTYLEEFAGQYETEIHRLKSVQFTNRGVVEICQQSQHEST